MKPTPVCSVVELRQYTMQPGRRDDLIHLFEREFIESQAAVGLHVLGIFCDADRPERFVWLRGYADMAARGIGLPAFYDGPVWRRRRDVANATMVDASDVRLLRPLCDWPAPGIRAPGHSPQAWHAVVCPVAVLPRPTLIAALQASTDTIWLHTEPAENNFPRHALRSGETVVVGLARRPVQLPADLQAQLAGPVQVLHLLPTSRSPLC